MTRTNDEAIANNTANYTPDDQPPMDEPEEEREGEPERMPPSFLDQLYEFQEQQLRRYECHGCGLWFPVSELHERTYFDQGERMDVDVCDLCIKRGWNPGWHGC